MTGNVADEAFARVVNQMGIATLLQIDAAKAVQAESANKGVVLPLADVLLQQGILTPALRENVERKCQAMQVGGIQVLGPYKMLRKLGEGGMGAVYLAEDTAMGRKVALKVLSKKHSGDPEFLARFSREAKATGQLNHVNIVCAYSVGEELGHHFIVMEYCEGESLDKLLAQRQPLPWDRAIEIVMQVARGLKHAHQHGIIHRDIKPANIVLTSQGTAKILDMGLSKQLGEGDQSFRTQTGVALGTAHYMSPEQARGERALDQRSDIYSLGATLYHLVTGQTPFHGSTVGVIMTKQLNEQLTNPQDLNADLPDGVAHVVTRMMAKEPADRYRDCKELLDDLELVIDGKDPCSHAIDTSKSSIAMRVRVAPPRRVLPRGAVHAPVAPAARHAGHARHGEAALEKAAPAPAPGAALGKYIGLGAGVLGVVVVIVALSMAGKPGREAPASIAKGEANEKVGGTAGAPPAKGVAVTTMAHAAGAPAAKEAGTASQKAADSTKPEAAKTELAVAALQPKAANVKPEGGVVDDAWVRSVQALPAEAQVQKVMEKLKELNPQLGGQVDYIVEDGKVSDLNLWASGVTNLSPVAALPLTSLNCGSAKVTDLSPLAGMRLKALFLNHSDIQDLSPLKNLPLATLHIEHTQVRDLSPLRGMPLTTLYYTATPVTDISPLKDLPLKEVRCDFQPERDAAVLRAINTLEKINDLPVAEFWRRRAQVAEQPQTPAPKAVPVVPAGSQLLPGLWARWYAREGGMTAHSLSDKTANPLGTRTVENLNILDRQRLSDLFGRFEDVAIRFWGYLEIPRDDTFTFHVSSDDGAVLEVGDVLTVDNDGDHGFEEKRGSAPFKAGLYLFRVRYYQGAAEAGLAVSWSAPGMPKQVIPVSACSRPADADERAEKLAQRVARAKPPVPDTAAQREAEKVIKNLYHAEYAKTVPADKLALAQKLLREGTATNDNAPAKFVLLREARDVAALVGDSDIGIRATDEAARAFAIDALGEKVKVCEQVERSATTADAARMLADRCLELADQATTADKYDIALRLAAKAEAAARSAQDSALAAKAREKQKVVQDIQREASNTVAAMKTLEKNPEDPVANAAVGRFLVLFKGDCDKGLPMLAKGSDAVLKALAEKELARPGDGNAQVALGDLYWDLSAKQQTGAFKAALSARAVKWYKVGVVTATGLTKSKAYTRIDAANPEWSTANARYVDLLPLIDPKKDGIGSQARTMWRIDNGELIGETRGYAFRITIPYLAPEEYDFRLVFSKPQPDGFAGAVLYKARHQFHYCIDPKRIWVDVVPDDPLRTVYERAEPLQPNRRYTTVVQVRNGIMRAYLDDELILECKPDYKNAQLHPNVTLNSSEALGVEQCYWPVVFHRIELIEVTGKGRRLR